MRSAVVAAAVTVLLAAGCSGDDTTAPKPDFPTESPPRWNPCDGLDQSSVAASFGTTFSVRTGTDSAPECRFSPSVEGDPALEVNYQLFPGTLDELLSTFGELPDGALTRVNGPDLADADDAAVIVDVNDTTLAVTGFVQNGGLVQVVNALDPAPFDRGQVRRAVRSMLAALATHASETGVGQEG